MIRKRVHGLLINSLRKTIRSIFKSVVLENKMMTSVTNTQII